jgi:hypothetical protein
MIIKAKEFAAVGTGPLVRSSSLNSNVGTSGSATWVLLMIAAAIMQSTAASARESGPNVSLAARVADGRPWQMLMDDGRTTSLVLFADGTGLMTGGPMQLSPKWRPTADGMCLKPMPLMSERCVILIPTKKGFVGSRDGTTVFTLER